jgi:hypothetical protein
MIILSRAKMRNVCVSIVSVEGSESRKSEVLTNTPKPAK